jgi:hypothetical protein
MTGTDVLDADGRRGFRGRLVAVVLGVVLAGGACSSGDDAPDSATQGSRPAADSATTAGDHGESSPPTDAAVTDLAAPLAVARAATAKYATDLDAAKTDGYQIITPNMPDMGYHFLNPDVTGFDPARPHILVYQRTDRGWHLGALEWVFPEEPAEPPLPGATYGSFDAACHYRDGTFEVAGAEGDCPPDSPTTGVEFSFWHPPLVTMHVWLWYPNPDGVFAGTNPLVHPFNDDVPASSPASETSGR